MCCTVFVRVCACAHGFFHVCVSLQGWGIDDAGVNPVPVLADFNGVCAADHRDKVIKCACNAGFYGPQCSTGVWRCTACLVGAGERPPGGGAWLVCSSAVPTGTCWGRSSLVSFAIEQRGADASGGLRPPTHTPCPAPV
jgi:hypothetical protein